MIDLSYSRWVSLNGNSRYINTIYRRHNEMIFNRLIPILSPGFKRSSLRNSGVARGGGGGGGGGGTDNLLLT